MTDHNVNERTFALVTGANRGIGREIVAQLAALGITVLLAARDSRRAAEAAGVLRAAGGDVRPISLDVTDPGTVRAAAEDIEDRFGRLDVLVNNAGITGAGIPVPSGGWRQVPSTADLDTVRAVFGTKSARPRRALSMSPAASAVPLPRRPIRTVHLPPFPRPLPIRPPRQRSTRSPCSTPASSATRRSGSTSPIRDGPDTDLNNHAGIRTAAQGAAVAVRLATLGPDGPTGGFFSDDGPMPW